MEVIHKPTGDDMLLGFMKRHSHYCPIFMVRQFNLKERLLLPKTSCLSFVEVEPFFRHRELGREMRDAPSPFALMGFAGLGIKREQEGDVCCVRGEIVRLGFATGKVIRTHDRGCNESVFLLQCIVLTLSSDLILLSLACHTCCVCAV